MKPKISILSHTHASYVEAIQSQLGKGAQHALLVYEDFFRHGCATGNHPAFSNCKSLYDAIVESTDFCLPTVSGNRSDGMTGKFLVQTHDKLEVESVLIPMQAGGTLCISSQVGCRMGCAFCETGKMGLLRNLTTEEIVSQVFIARHELKMTFRNIVFMGMGEPFDNYDAVMKAVRVLGDAHGFGFGKKNMTVSTSGCVDGIEKLQQETGWTPNLAVSINAPSDELRNKLMPVNRRYSLSDLHHAMLSYNQSTGRQILVAYVLMKDVNDSLEHADQLAAYLRQLNVKINLIPYNPQSRDRFERPETSVLENFTTRLRNHGYYTLLRLTKGTDIMAACGQLGNLALRKERNKALKLAEIPAPADPTKCVASGS